MVLLEKISLKEVSNILHRKFIGAANHVISGLNEIHNVEEGDLIYVDHPKYYKSALNSLADTIIIDKEVEVPDYAEVGYDLEKDRKNFDVTASGIVIVGKKEVVK